VGFIPSNVHLREKDVDRSGEKDWTDRDEDNLHDETSIIPRVLPVKDASDISKHLIDAPSDHAGHEPPCLVTETCNELNDRANAI
jgi:hypothetical protein